MSTPLYNRLDELRNTCSWATSEQYSTLAEGVDDLAVRIAEGGGISNPLSGSNLNFVDQYIEEFTLADTSFVIGTTAPSSATSIKATVSNRYTSDTIDIYDKDIVIVQTLRTKPYHSAENNVSMQMVSGTIMVSYFSKDFPNFTSSARTTRRIFSTSSINMIDYYNASGAPARAAASYGLYGTLQAPTVVSTTANSTKVRAGAPALYARVSSTYESSANMKLINSCNWEWRVNVYTADPSSTLGGYMREELNWVMYPDY